MGNLLLFVASFRVVSSVLAQDRWAAMETSIAWIAPRIPESSRHPKHVLANLLLLVVYSGMHSIAHDARALVRRYLLYNVEGPLQH